MAKVYCDFFDVTVDGNMLTRHGCEMDLVPALALVRPQLTIVRTGGTILGPVFDISYPMNEDDHRIFAALVHRANSENKLDKNKKIGQNTPPDDNPDGTPPGGGTPGTPVIVQQEFIKAIAA